MASITTTSGISSTLGQYSGITADDIESLLQADSVGKTKAQNQITTLTDQKTAWSDVKTRLNNFLTKVTALQSDDTYQTKKTSSSDATIASITGDTTSAEGTYDLKVDQLATASKITGTRLDVKSSKTALGVSGSLTLTSAEEDTDGNAKTFDFDISDTDSLNDIATKINKETSNSSIKASVVDNRLVLTDSKMGARDISISGDAADSLGLGSSATTSKGQFAIFELDGMKITRDTNTVSDAVEGTTFTLSKVSDDHVTLSLANDTSKTVSAVNDMVTQYNSLMSLISDDLSVGDPSQSDNTTGKLAGDSELMRLQSSLRNMITNPYITGSTLNPNKVGISTVDREGTLGLDQDKLNAAIADDPTAVKNMFYQSTENSIGTVTSESGYASDLSTMLNTYLVDSSANKGIIATKSAGYDSSIKDLNKQIDDFNTMLDAKKTQYVDMFTRLDEVMMEAQSQMSYLTSQTSSLSS
ncbi:flagellar filament capping protein FliD [Liquorilactobacillus uvarum]|uniref:Flagellar hook-associated protein 2 n=2 Tax=Liquorilactobacillus uvarum TaxID=303240 RepID=A0A0R1PYM7_9LACO|nr:flagellar filament capping protein FliD [Liquorilactobacillus uvarum]AJA34394.1 flagellar hook-associated protein 2 [Liquorilactobacillus uvarum DSM 19971]KRL37606.1 flagellum hook associated protein FliD [Liquorilactobacillus uvarum DSM 19971]